MLASKRSPRPSSVLARSRFFAPRLESLEDRFAPAVLGLGTASIDAATVAFNRASGTLSLLGNGASTAQLTSTSEGGLTLTVNGHSYSSDTTSAAFSPALAGATLSSLHQISLTGGTADSLTLHQLGSTGALSINTDGGVAVAGALNVSGKLAITAASLDVTGTVQAAALALTTTGLLEIEAGGSINAGSIAANSDYFVNVGQVGATGGNLTINTRNYLNSGSISSNGTAGGSVLVDFTSSYIDDASATTTASGTNGNGGTVEIDGGATGRLFTSGHFAATGANGGAVELFGQNVLLIGASVDASGTKGSGGTIFVGGDAPSDHSNLPLAQTVQVSANATIHADGTSAGGRVEVWSAQTTTFTGTVTAKGGSGGFIDVSSVGVLTYGGSGDAGKGGTLLLDPKFIVISAAPTGVAPQYNLVNPGTNGAFGTQVLTLTNGNIVVTDPTVNNNTGAVYLFNGQSGVLISTFTGVTSGTSGDEIGNGGVTALTNGNFVISSPDWSGTQGAATWGSGTSGVSGTVSVSNSLVGSTQNDEVGVSILALSNGNYLAVSTSWSSLKGEVTFGKGTTGVVGQVNAGNSLVGSSNDDQVGQSIRQLTNGNYVVSSPFWNNDTGAATFGNGTTGVTGNINSSNSLVGSTTGDFVGNSGVTALTNGNYVVSSQQWGNGLGAATWGNGSTGTTGTISVTNSLIGSTTSDSVGAAGVTALTNGNYVVASPSWFGDFGAATWGNGASGVKGTISSLNSLIGSKANDQVGVTVVPLTNGNYVVASRFWNGNIGAATWGNGTAGTDGSVSAANSLTGSTAGDQVGATVIALTNGNYVVGSPSWSGLKGAASWAGGTGATTGVVAASNSLVGTVANDQVGSRIYALTNGNYVVGTPTWNGNIGAATWGLGTSGVTGAITSTNSIIGSTANDGVGDVIVVLTNGNYVVSSPSWNANEGAATWANGTTGIIGMVSVSNSLVGASPGDFAGGGGQGSVVALSNGNYVVNTPRWKGFTGAVTFGNGTVGVKGTIAAANSFIGSSTTDTVGSGGIVTLANGNYAISSPSYGNNQGAATFVYGATGTTLDGSGVVTPQNSVVASLSNAGLSSITQGGAAASFVVVFKTLNAGTVVVGIGDPNLLTYALALAQTLTVTPAFITNTLAAGTSVVLAANDDITINSPITVTPTGTAGNLTLKAGRSILINASINTGGGNLTLTANDTKADGVIDAQRDTGNAIISMQSGTTINLGTGTLTVNMLTGTDKTNNGAGTVTMQGITANVAIFGAGSGTYTLGLTPNGGTLKGAAYNVTITKVGTIQAYGRTGDVAYLYDTTGQNTFVATPTYGFFAGSNFYNQEVGFPTVNAFAAKGSVDTAYLYDTGVTNNVFVGTPTYSYMSSGATYFNQPVGFAAVNAYAASTSNDAAYLFDNGGTNTFIGTSTYAYLQGSGYFDQTIGFKSVAATAGTGATDAAYLFGASSGGNVFTSNSAYAYLYGTGYLVEPLGYKTVSATGTKTDTANLYDGPGANGFNGAGAVGTLTNGTVSNSATSFGYVNIIASQGSSDVATTSSIVYTLTKYGTWT